LYSVEDIKKEYLKGKTLRYSQTKNKDIYNYIEDEIKLDISHKEKVYCFVNNILPKCKNPNCKNIKVPKFQDFKSGYKDFCSISCSVICSRDTQEKSLILNIQDKVKDMDAQLIVHDIYHKKLKIKRWRDIEKLKDYLDFSTLEQVYKHVVLNQNQICDYCKKPFDFDKKNKKPRKCACNTKKDRLFIELCKIEDFDIFLAKCLDNNLHYSINSSYKKFKEEVYKRKNLIKKTDNLLENIYCYLNKIEPQDKEFINLRLGYKQEEIKIDYSKDDLSIISQMREKYSIKGIYSSKEFIQWLNLIQDFEFTKSNKEKVYCIENDIHSVPICINPECNNKTKFAKKDLKYNSYCSVSCSNKNTTDKRHISSKNSFIKRKLPLILKESEVELLEEYVNTKHKHTFRCLRCNDIFKSDFYNKVLCNCKKIEWMGVSSEETEVYEYAKSIYDFEIIRNDRHLGLELDLYFPDIKLAIEYNGIYWHSSKFKDKEYHINKTKICEENDIQLIHIFSNEWKDKNDIVKSIIKLKIGQIEDRIYARKCIIKKVSSKISNKFLEENCIQGKDDTTIRYGLYYENKLAQLMILKRSHKSKDKHIELKRNATKLNCIVIGGFSKLLKHIKSIFKEDIITFADRRYSYKENIYSKLGKKSGKTDPNYFWVNGNNLEIKEKTQKHKLKYKIYDCGNWKYLL